MIMHSLLFEVAAGLDCHSFFPQCRHDLLAHPRFAPEAMGWVLWSLTLSMLGESGGPFDHAQGWGSEVRAPTP